MPAQLQIRLVTTAEDADRERVAAAETAGYRVASVDTIRVSPQGIPRDRSLRESLPQPGLSEARFIDPVTVTIAVTVATLAVRLVNHWMKSREAGVQIDARTTPVTISRLAGVPFGTLAVIHRDGTTTIHRETYENPEDVMARLTELLPGA